MSHRSFLPPNTSGTPQWPVIAELTMPWSDGLMELPAGGLTMTQPASAPAWSSFDQEIVWSPNCCHKIHLLLSFLVYLITEGMAGAWEQPTHRHLGISEAKHVKPEGF